MSTIKQVRSNQLRQMQQYVDQFGKIGHARGMLGESVFQNTIDAAFRGVIGKVRVDVFVDPVKRSMTIRDRGTTGMYHCDECRWSDIIEDGEIVGECENFKNCRWSAFHTMAMEGKGVGYLGQRGMGKSLLSLAGTDGIKVRTRTTSGDTMASWFRPKKDSGVGAWEWLLLPDEAWIESGDPGTEIEVVGLKDEFIKDFKNMREMVKDYILPHWFFAIADGMEVKLMYRDQEPIRISPASLEEMFPKEGQLLGKKTYDSVPIKIRGKTAGKISGLNIFLAKEPIAEELRGIALVKDGKQVIKRLQSFGRAIDPELQDCVFGWVNTGDLLDKFETPNHLDYKSRELLVRKVREKVEGLTRSFLEPFQKERQKSKPVSREDIAKAEKIREAVNKAFDEVPEFNPWDDGKGPGTQTGENGECKKCGQKPCVCPRPPPKEKTKPWISSIKFEPKTESGYYDSGEEIKARVIISNPLDKKFPTMGLKWAATNLSHESVIGPFTVSKDEFGELPRGYGGIEGPGQIEKEFEFEVSLGKPTDGGFRKGKNWFKVAIYIEEDDDEVIPIDETKRGFFVEYKPEPNRIGSSGTNRIESFQVLPPGIGQGYDVNLEAADMILYIYSDGPNIEPYWGKGSKHSDAVSNIFYGVADSIMELLLPTRLSPDSVDNLGAQEHEDVDFEDVYYELIGIKTRWIAAAHRIAGV